MLPQVYTIETNVSQKPKVHNHNVPHNPLSPTMALWNKQRQLSRRIDTHRIVQQHQLCVIELYHFPYYLPCLPYICRPRSKDKHVSSILEHMPKVGCVDGQFEGRPSSPDVNVDTILHRRPASHECELYEYTIAMSLSLDHNKSI